MHLIVSPQIICKGERNIICTFRIFFMQKFKKYTSSVEKLANTSYMDDLSTSVRELHVYFSAVGRSFFSDLIRDHLQHR